MKSDSIILWMVISIYFVSTNLLLYSKFAGIKSRLDRVEKLLIAKP